jgi:hypothetical protein
LECIVTALISPFARRDGDGLAREGAGDAEAVAEDGDGDHLVLGHLGHELVVGGLLREGKRLGQRVVQMV